jgi:hypothetical protein
MTVCAAILSAMVASCDGNYKLSRGGLALGQSKRVSNSLCMSNVVFCGVLGERFLFQGLNRREIRLIY